MAGSDDIPACNGWQCSLDSDGAMMKLFPCFNRRPCNCLSSLSTDKIYYQTLKWIEKRRLQHQERSIKVEGNLGLFSRVFSSLDGLNR